LRATASPEAVHPPARGAGPDPDWPDALQRHRPDLSAALPMSRWQRWALRAGLAGLAAGLT
jgi:hypothetical protein